MPELCPGTVFLQWLLREAGSQESVSLLWRPPREPVSRLGTVAAAPGPPKTSDLCWGSASYSPGLGLNALLTVPSPTVRDHIQGMIKLVVTHPGSSLSSDARTSDR